jgi:hypothetical protein
MRRSAEKTPDRLRIRAETCGCLMPRISPASYLNGGIHTVDGGSMA